eukprot:g1694.t1
MLSGGCALPVDCDFSVADALGYVSPSWATDIDTAPTSVVTACLSVEGETVSSFDAAKQAQFRASVASVAGVDVSAVEVTVRERGTCVGARRLSSASSAAASDAGVDITVMIRATSAGEASAVVSHIESESFVSELAAALADRGLPVSADSLGVYASSVSVVAHRLSDCDANGLADCDANGLAYGLADRLADVIAQCGAYFKPDGEPDGEPNGQSDGGSNSEPNAKPDWRPNESSNGHDNSQPDGQPDGQPHAVAAMRRAHDGAVAGGMYAEWWVRAAGGLRLQRG